MNDVKKPALGHIRCQSGGVVEDSSVQQVKTSAAIHLAFEHLDRVHLAFDLSWLKGEVNATVTAASSRRMPRAKLTSSGIWQRLASCERYSNIGSCPNPVTQSSRVVEDAATQEVNIRAPVGLTLEHLDPVDLPFDLSLAVWRGQCGGDGGSVTPHTTHEADQFWDATVRSVGQPGIELRLRSCADDPAKVDDESLGRRNRRARLTERLAIEAFVGVELFDGTQEDPMGLPRREAVWTRWRACGVVAAQAPSRSTWPRTPGTHILPHGGGRASKALRLNLAQQHGTLVLTFSPAPSQIRSIRAAGMWSTTTLGAGAVVSCEEIGADRLTTDPGASGHLAVRIAFCRQRDDLVIARQATGIDSRALAFDSRERWRAGSRLFRCVGGVGLVGLSQSLSNMREDAMFADQEAIQRLPEIPDQMKAVSDLDGLGRTLAGAVSKRPTSVATDHLDLDSAMRSQPRGECRGLTIREEVNHTMLVEVYQ